MIQQQSHFSPRTPLEFLMMRRTVADGERILAEALAAMRKGSPPPGTPGRRRLAESLRTQSLRKNADLRSVSSALSVRDPTRPVAGGERKMWAPPLDITWSCGSGPCARPIDRL